MKSHYVDVLLLNRYCLFIYLFITIISLEKQAASLVLVITCISVLLLIYQVLLLLASLFFSRCQQHV